MPNLLTRDDTLLGVCQGLGEDVGFNPNWLRVALASVLLFSPIAAIGTYFALGLVVMIGRWWWPASVAAEPTPVTAAPAVVADNDEGVAFASAA